MSAHEDTIRETLELAWPSGTSGVTDALVALDALVAENATMSQAVDALTEELAGADELLIRERVKTHAERRRADEALRVADELRAALDTAREALMKLRVHGSSWWGDEWAVSKLAAGALDATDAALSSEGQPRAAFTRDDARAGVSAHDPRADLAADISLWQFFRGSGYPPVGTSEPDVDGALGRIIDRARLHARLVPPPQEVLDALDAWLETEKPDGVEVTSEQVARAEAWAKVRDYRAALSSEGQPHG